MNDTKVPLRHVTRHCHLHVLHKCHLPLFVTFSHFIRKERTTLLNHPTKTPPSQPLQIQPYTSHFLSFQITYLQISVDHTLLPNFFLNNLFASFLVKSFHIHKTVPTYPHCFDKAQHIRESPIASIIFPDNSLTKYAKF